MHIIGESPKLFGPRGVIRRSCSVLSMAGLVAYSDSSSDEEGSSVGERDCDGGSGGGGGSSVGERDCAGGSGGGGSSVGERDCDGGSGGGGGSDVGERDCDGGRGGDTPPGKKARIENSPSHFLPLPSSILDMFPEEEGGDGSAVSEDRQGRVRSFPHVRGNWATFVFIPVPYSRNLGNCITAFHEPLRSILDPGTGTNPPEFIPMPQDSLHVSLSRTVATRHHCIEPLTHMLGERLRTKKRFTLGFSSLAFYSNDEKTTSFLGVKISKSYDQLCSVVSDVDECFAQYNLQQFYKNPSFHMSIYWCAGDIVPRVTDRHIIQLQECWEGLVSEYDLAAAVESVDVTGVRLKSGNKCFSFPLSDT